MKLRPIAVSAMRRTAGLPSFCPQTPFTKAPSSGIPRMKAISEKLFDGNSDSRKCMARSVSWSVPQQVGFVGADRALDAEEREDDREPDGHLGRLRRDDEERE